MTTALQILAAIIAALTLSALFGCVFGAFIDAGMHPRRGEGDQQGARDVNAELDGRGLPTRVIDLNHNGSIYS